MPTLAQLETPLADLLDLAAHAADSLADLATVDLELRLARAAGADAAAEPRHGGAAPGQARKHVAKLRQFHLQPALARARAAREDIEDQLGPVDHLRLQRKVAGG